MNLSILCPTRYVFGATLSCFLSLGVNAQGFGKTEYQASCASCHGVSAKGDGPISGYLIRPPTDLTLLAKRNSGVLPVSRIWQTIDGRADTATGPHGSREMPVWGQVYRSDDGQPVDLNVRNRIAALIDYLSGIQEK